jgi:hypothetical protein
VEHKRDVTAGALPHPPAQAAGEEVRPAAAVEQDDRLLAAASHAVELLPGALVERSRGPRHPDDLDRRQAPAVDPLGEREPLVAHEALGARRGAAGEQQRALELCAVLRDDAGVVARVPLLLVGAVVLLVDHDQAQVADGGKHRGPRADADARLAAPHPPPLVVALAGREA